MSARWLLLLLLAGGCAGTVGNDLSVPSSPPAGGQGGAIGGASGPGTQPPANMTPSPSAPPPVVAPPVTPPPGGGTPPASPPPAATPGDASCARLVPVSAFSFEDLPAAPGARLRVRAELNAGPATQSWSWSVLFGDGAGVDVPTTNLDAQASVIEVPLEKAGRYRLAAFTQVAGIPCMASALAYALSTDKRLAQFRLRLAPPPGLSFPTQDSAVQAQAGTPLSQPLVLQRGAEVVLEPHDASGRGGVSSYVRVTETRSALTVEGHTGGGPFRALLLAPFTYDVLFVPDGELAPLLHVGKTPAALNVLPLELTPGTAVTGLVLDPAGTPVRDGRIVLRAGALTSTVGTSDAAGAFSLRARGGTFAVAVAPPPDAGLPELALAIDPGLAIPEAPSAGTAEIRWAPVSAAAVSLAVRLPDGLRPAAGARVRLERAGVLPAAATLTLRSPSGAMVTRTLEGQARAAGQAGADGLVPLPSLPAGRYQVTVVPDDADTTSALTVASIEVGAAAPASIKLATKVRLHGTLLPGDAAAGTRVFAAPRAVDPPRPLASGIVAAGGAYEILVDPGRDYLVWAEPPAGRSLARAQLASVGAGTAGAEVPTRTLPKALLFTSTVEGDNLQGGLPGVVLQAFCDPSSPACLDPTLPLAETVSAAKGAFTLVLPDPGSF